MQALWLSLKENVNCKSKLTENVVIWPKRHHPKKTCKPSNETLDRKFIRQMRNSFREVIIGQCSTRTQLCELNIGDPARNITEMIFYRATTNPVNPSRKIKRVLRVKNSIDILQKFERYREEVKENAYEQHKRHPRSSVDGNELLRFYGTTMSCSSRKSTRVSELCKDPACGVCRTLQSNFDTECTKMNGIRLSTNSEEVSDNSSVYQKSKRTGRAVLVCRTIAGMDGNKVEEIDEGSNSIASEGQSNKSRCLIMKNPSAILPCFVIVFS